MARRRSDVRKNTTTRHISITREGEADILKWAEINQASFSAAIESLARMGLGKSPGQAIAPVVISAVRRAMLASQNHLARVMFHGLMEGAVARRLIASGLFMLLQDRAHGGAYPDLRASLLSDEVPAVEDVLADTVTQARQDVVRAFHQPLEELLGVAIRPAGEDVEEAVPMAGGAPAPVTHGASGDGSPHPSPADFSMEDYLAGDAEFEALLGALDEAEGSDLVDPAGGTEGPAELPLLSDELEQERLSAEGARAIRRWASANGLSFTQAIETLALLGLGESPATAFAPAIASSVRTTMTINQARFTKILVHALVESAIARRLVATALFVLLQDRARSGAYPDLAGSLLGSDPEIERVLAELRELARRDSLAAFKRSFEAVLDASVRPLDNAGDQNYS